MNDKIVTHEDLSALRGIREAATSRDTYYPGDATSKFNPIALLDRLIAAAEADQPPLPEGWVLLDGDDGSKYPYWHEDNRLYRGRGGDAYKIEATAASMRDRLTPLRPTVTEADVEKAASEVERLAIDLNYTDLTRAAFEAAGIEVSDR